VTPDRPDKLARVLEDALTLLNVLRQLVDDRPAPEGPPEGSQPPRPLKHIHRQLLKHATAEPIPAKRLIGLAGYKHNSYARGAIADLLRLGMLRRLEGGVCLPDKPVT
jgi:hypothetical protein